MMTEQHHSQTNHQSVEQGASVEANLARLWAEFGAARARLAEVMSDDELRGLGVDVEVLDERP